MWGGSYPLVSNEERIQSRTDFWCWFHLPRNLYWQRCNDQSLQLWNPTIEIFLTPVLLVSQTNCCGNIPCSHVPYISVPPRCLCLPPKEDDQWYQQQQQQLSHLSQVFGVGYMNQKRITPDWAHGWSLISNASITTSKIILLLLHSD